MSDPRDTPPRALEPAALNSILARWWQLLARRYRRGPARRVADTAIAELIALLVRERRGEG